VILTSSEGERFEFVATLPSGTDCAVNQLKADLIEDITVVCEYLVKILDTLERISWSKRIRMCKVQWSHHAEDETTREREDNLQAEFSQLFASPVES
jgi:hypothetical protein